MKNFAKFRIIGFDIPNIRDNYDDFEKIMSGWFSLQINDRILETPVFNALEYRDMPSNFDVEYNDKVRIEITVAGKLSKKYKAYIMIKSVE